VENVLPLFFAIAGGVCLMLVLLALWHSLRLLIGGGSAGGDERAAMKGGGDFGRVALLHEKDSLLGAIRELRFEHELGKVSDADLGQREQRYRGRAREVLRLLEEELAPHREKAAAMIEAARREAGRKDKAAPSAAPASAPAVAAAAPSAPLADKVVCASCSTGNDVDAAFCKKCGSKLASQVPSP